MATVNVVVRTLRQVNREIEAGGAHSALVGGLAVSARGHPRYTADIDLAVAVADDRHAQALVNGLLKEGFQIRSLIEQEATGRIATVRLDSPGAEGRSITVDLLFASCGIEPEIVAGATVLTGSTVPLPIASIGHLIAMKLLSDSPERLQDRLDLQYLLSRATPEDLRLAADAVSMIEARGFNRGRDLRGALENWMARPSADNGP